MFLKSNNLWIIIFVLLLLSSMKWVNELFAREWPCHIVLTVKPEITLFKSSAASHTACQHVVISFHCTANGNPPVMSYHLLENDTAILDINTSGMWSRKMSTRGVFMYRCMANNTYGNESSENIAVRVYG